MFKDISDALASFLKAKRLDRNVARIWVFRRTCVVVDFAYKNIKFAFDFTPSKGDLISVDLVQRRYETALRVTAASNGKERIAQDVSLGQALELLHARVIQTLSVVDKYFDNRNNSLVPPISSENAVHSDAGLEKRSVPMKVGVLTLPLNANIGGNLQAYALMEVLKQLGHSPVLINRQRPPEGRRDDDDASTKDAKWPLISKSFAKGKKSQNFSFIDKHIFPISRPFQSTTQLKNNIDRYEFDAVIVGSDQVWRPKYAKSILKDFFFHFLPEENNRVKRISYAASFGGSHWEFDAKQTRAATQLIKRFSAISVREDSAVTLCRSQLGVEAQHVLDPTLLLAPGHYAQIFSSKSRHSNGGQLTTYILDRDEDKVQVVDALSRRLSIDAYSADGQPFGSADPSNNEEGDKSVEGWLASFHDAAFVATDSFHGVAFSILFNKPFIAYGNPGRGMARFTSLLKMVGLEDRLVVDSAEVDLEKMLRPVDWQAVNGRLETLRAESIRFLVSALSGDGPEGERAPSASAAIGDVPSARALSSHSSYSSYSHPLNVHCTGCGVCVSESQGSLGMVWNEDGFLVPQARSADIPANVMKVCPFNPQPEKEVEDEDALGNIFLPNARRFDSRAGRFENAYIGYSSKFRPTSSSGGIATYVFEKLLERGDVDYLYVVQSDGKNGYQYRVFDKGDDILKTSKTRYFPVSLDGLFSAIERTEGRVAVSGVACFIKAIRLKQYYYPEFREKIPFLVGIICGGLKSRNYTDFLAQSAGIHGSYTGVEYRVKDQASSANDYSFSAIDEQSQSRSVKMRRVGEMWGTGLFKARACDFCTDVLTELADISLGDAWLPDYNADGMGNSVVLTRSILAERIIQAGIKAGELVIEQVPVSRVAQSQSGGFNHKHKGLKFRTWMDGYVSNIPMPVVRERIFKSISLPNAVVQVHRERTRSKSLMYWNKTRNAKAFTSRMRSSLKNLRVATAARQDGNSNLLAMLSATKPPDTVRSAKSSTAGSYPMLRWLMRKVRARQLTFDMLPAAQLEAPAEHLQEMIRDAQRTGVS